MSPIGEWVAEALGAGEAEVYAPEPYATRLRKDGIAVVGEHPERPWLVVVAGPDIETACNPGA